MYFGSTSEERRFGRPPRGVTFLGRCIPERDHDACFLDASAAALIGPGAAFSEADRDAFGEFLFPTLCLTQKRHAVWHTHAVWLLSVEQTRINPFTRRPAKLPCRQALHLKCTISYPCLV